MSHVISIPKINGYDMESLKQQGDIQALGDKLISNNGFYPDISLNELRNAMRIDGTITNNRLTLALIEAMASVNDELRPFQQTQEKTGVISLAELEADNINGESILLQRYKRAVYCFTVANLFERYRGYDSSKENTDSTENDNQSIDELRRDGLFAIRDLLKQTRINVELI